LSLAFVKRILVLFLFGFLNMFFSIHVWAQTQKALDLEKTCFEMLGQFKGASNKELLGRACARVTVLDQCQSVNKVPLFHFQKEGYLKIPKRILVFSLIHGDEIGAGSVGRYWIENLERISPRNTWRVIPILNPDGLALKTRTNLNQIDLNRNFPTKDWSDSAQLYWKKTNMNPRRFPGKAAGSEPEVVCALSHIQDFSPDFVVSIHTPLHVLDFDGPQIRPPKYDYLPWKSLGHFPGSLGRYLWFERETPVLTMELKQELPQKFDTFEKLQDVIGTLVKFETGVHAKQKHLNEISSTQ
jgi:protein MpaA